MGSVEWLLAVLGLAVLTNGLDFSLTAISDEAVADVVAKAEAYLSSLALDLKLSLSALIESLANAVGGYQATVTQETVILLTEIGRLVNAMSLAMYMMIFVLAVLAIAAILFVRAYRRDNEKDRTELKAVLADGEKDRAQLKETLDQNRKLLLVVEGLLGEKLEL